MTTTGRIDPQSKPPVAPKARTPGPAPSDPTKPSTVASPSPPPSVDEWAVKARKAFDEPWHLPDDLMQAGPEIRRHIALVLGGDSGLVALDKQYQAGLLDEATYKARRAERVERAAYLVRNEFEAAAADKAGVSRPYFSVVNCNTLLRLSANELGDYPGKALEDLRWDVFNRFRSAADADPEVQRLTKARDDRRKALGNQDDPWADPRLGEISAQLRIRENEIRLATQSAYMAELDQHLEIDAVTRRQMKAFVEASQPGTIASGVWTSLTARLIRTATHRPGEMDASHSALAVLPGLYYEAVVEPPPEATGVKPTSALELFAGFHGNVRSQAIQGLTPQQTQGLYDFAITKQGTPYNRLGVALGISGVASSVRQDASYYCAEFVARALTQVGVKIETQAGNTPFEAGAPSSALQTALNGVTYPLRLVRALPYTVVRVVAPGLAQKLNGVGLTFDDAFGSPRMSPQKLINASFNGKPATLTFDLIEGRGRQD